MHRVEILDDHCRQAYISLIFGGHGFHLPLMCYVHLISVFFTLTVAILMSAISEFNDHVFPL